MAIHPHPRRDKPRQGPPAARLLSGPRRGGRGRPISTVSAISTVTGAISTVSSARLTVTPAQSHRHGRNLAVNKIALAVIKRAIVAVTDIDGREHASCPIIGTRHS